MSDLKILIDLAGRWSLRVFGALGKSGDAYVDGDVAARSPHSKTSDRNVLSLNVQVDGPVSANRGCLLF